MNDFIDHEALRTLAEKAQEALEGLGLTVVMQQVQIDPSTGDPVLIMGALVRKTAFEHVTGDLEVRKEVQRMAADEHQRQLDERIEKYTKALEEGRILDVLTGKGDLVDCDHATVHEGLCLSCHEEVTDGET